MPFHYLNDMEQHDGTNLRYDFGGPYYIRLMLNGTELYRGQVGKDYTLYLSLVPKGEDEDD